MSKFQKVGLALVGLMAGTVAQAAVPVVVGTAVTDLSALAVDYSTAFIPLAVAVSLAFIGIKWVRRFIGSST